MKSTSWMLTGGSECGSSRVLLANFVGTLSRRYAALKPSRRTSLPSLGGTSAFTRYVSSPADECTAKAWSWSSGGSSRKFAEERTGFSQVPGEPRLSVCHVPNRRRQDCYCWARSNDCRVIAGYSAGTDSMQSNGSSDWQQNCLASING